MECAHELALSALLKADFALSITGYQGPTGYDAQNPTGTVYISFADKNLKLSHTIKEFFPPSRTEWRNRVVKKALQIIAMHLMEHY